MYLLPAQSAIPGIFFNGTSPSLLVQPIMHTLSTLLLGSLAFQNVLGRLAQRSVDDFIKKESQIALDQLLCNIGPDGCRAFGAASGVVIASPNLHDPDYYYTWTRDSALVFKTIVDRFTQNYDAGLQHRIEQYIAAQAKMQGVSNPSGSLTDGSGLGEAKYEVTIEPFSGGWGRPQPDGPALRAIAMIGYAKWLLKNDYKSTVSDIIWPIVRNDLNYLTQYWNHKGFDLWEEVYGNSFFTIANQYRALIEGASLAATLGQPGNSYTTVAPQVLCFLQTFWVSSGGYLDANINVNNDNRAGKDVNTILASIHTFDPNLGCDAATFQPCSDKALSNHKAVVDSFRFYNINKGIPAGQAVAVGRYAEDVFYTGNAWYLATLASAEQLYDAVYVWKKEGSITVTSTSLPFFKDFVSDIKAGTYSSGQSTFTTLVNAVTAYADGFVSVVSKYTPADGSLSEQFNKDNGTPLSATHLTWSYAAFLTAAARRAGTIPPSWANKDSTTIPGTCSGTNIQGSYASATATSFPANQTPKTGTPPATPTTPCTTPTAVAVTFRELVNTEFGQTIKVSGNTDALGNWDTSKAVALGASEYQSDHPLWQGTVNLKSGQTIEYKYINVQQDGSVNWEGGPNHTYSVPKACATMAVKSDRWQS